SVAKRRSTRRRPSPAPPSRSSSPGRSCGAPSPPSRSEQRQAPCQISCQASAWHVRGGMTWADVKARLIDRLTERAEREFGPRRRTLLAAVRGRVLEIGAGTGANVRHYPDGMGELVLVEPNDAFARLLRSKLEQRGLKARIVSARA